MNYRQIKEMAKRNAKELRTEWKLKEENPLGIILGTGWDNILSSLEDVKTKSLLDFFSNVQFFEQIKGHKKEIFYGKTQAGREIVGLNGRIHLNESPGNPDIFNILRFSIEVLIEMGVKKMIITSASGSLRDNELIGKIETGHVVLIDRFLSLFAPQMPLWGGEFTSPESSLSKEMIKKAYALQLYYLENIQKVSKGCYAMLLGPNFEGIADKNALKTLGADIVGMSVYPETCIASLYGVKVLAISFVTNGVEETSHESNLEIAKKYGGNLIHYLNKIIEVI